MYGKNVHVFIAAYIHTYLGLLVELAAAEHVVDGLGLGVYMTVGILVEEEVQRLLLASNAVLYVCMYVYV
jgi:hypothetical protein